MGALVYVIDSRLAALAPVTSPSACRTDARHSRVPGETNLAKERFCVGHQGLLLGAARPGFPVEVGGPARPLVERAGHALGYALEDG